MDGRDDIAFSGGFASYYTHRGGVAGSVPGTQNGGFQAPPTGFRALSNTSIQSQSTVRGGSVGSTFSLEPPRANLNHGITVGASPEVLSSEPVKKKRGRPRKYDPDGPVSLKLSPMSATAKSTPGLSTSLQKRGRGRPPGSGRKQQLASLGEWMNNSAGLAFSPHVITIGVGEDIVAKLLSVSQQRPRALCVMSGTGTVSSVTIRQPVSNSVSLTFEGQFQILCLSGSYLVAEDGGPHKRTGGLSVSLSSSDGHVIGGGVAMLIAASPVQVVVCSFVHGSSKNKIKQENPRKDWSTEPQHGDKLASPASDLPSQNYTDSATGVWPGSWPADMTSLHAHTGIDLTRG